MINKLSLVFLFLLSACDGGPGETDPNPLHLPPQGFVGDSVKGKVLYDQNCQVCHGKNGLGTNQGPPLVNNIYNPRHHADLAFHLAVRNGVRSHHWKFGDMKPIPNLSPEDVEHIVQYVRKIQRKSGIQ
jgi:mono/diheme cytochrome c family protein